MILNPASNVVITPPPYSSEVFAENTWQEIINTCQANQVPDTWVADGSCYKDMEINGKNYRIDIIGKNHDTYASGGTAPPDFPDARPLRRNEADELQQHQQRRLGKLRHAFHPPARHLEPDARRSEGGNPGRAEEDQRGQPEQQHPDHQRQAVPAVGN